MRLVCQISDGWHLFFFAFKLLFRCIDVSVGSTNKTECALSRFDHFRALSWNNQSLSASAPLKDPLHQSEYSTVPDSLGGSLPEAVLLPQSTPFPLSSDLCPVQPLVETPVETRVRQDSDNRRSASQTQPEDLFVHTVAPHRPLLETRGKARK